MEMNKMTLAEFIENYDKEGSIVLLEGKREVWEGHKAKCVALGKLLAEKTKHIMFRSGNAEGSDALFSEGVISVDPKRLQVITPYTGHRKKENIAYETYSLDDMNLTLKSEAVIQSEKHGSMPGLVSGYIKGQKNKNTMKAPYIIRDTVKVIGSGTVKPASFAIFYVDPLKPDSGGTGHTRNICIVNKVSFLDQRCWLKWLV